ncbi:tudor domain-containing protein 15 isoform X2 [Lepisosteus oculatus]|uniref:tudor domain-containing protein 15 isoform X2 n=1 Tax=Lepisosteus oculatus TaxID=7918 RepID=UPI0035F50283
MLSGTASGNPRPHLDTDLPEPYALRPVDLKLTHVDCNLEDTLVHFQGQYLTICELDYNILQAEIQNTHKTKETIEVGSYCLVEDVFSGWWCRGRVQNKCNNLFDVFLIDHGSVLNVDASHLASAPQELFMLPPKIVCGFFANILPVGETWNSLTMDYFTSLIGLEITGYIQAVLSHKVLVLEAPDINKEITRLGFGRHADKDTFLLLVEMLTEVHLKQNSKPVQGLLVEKHIEQEVSFTPSSVQCFQSILSSCGPKVCIGKTERGKITAGINPRTFFCQLMSMEKDLREMTESLSSSCDMSSELSQKHIGNMGVLCSVKWKDEKWHRGFVQQFLSNGQVRVLFVDYGFSDSVKVEHILQLDSVFLSTAVMAFPCALSCVNGHDETEQRLQLKKFKKGLLGRTLDIQIDSFCAEQNLYFVTLYSTEVDTDLDSCENASKIPSDARKGDESTSFYRMDHISSENGSLPQDGNCTDGKETQEGTVPVKEIQETSDFVGYTEHIVNPSNFWMRTEVRNGVFEDMMDKLTEYVNNLELHEGIMIDPEPGFLCCAMYEKDMHYYRAVITDVFDSGAEVFFIDFGNTEKVPGMCIKTLPSTFAAEPAFAIHCSLAHVVPVEDVWTSTATDYFRKVVSNKVLLASVVQKRTDKYIVDLHEKRDITNISIAMLMITAKLAEYWECMSKDYEQSLARAYWEKQKTEKQKNRSTLPKSVSNHFNQKSSSDQRVGTGKYFGMHKDDTSGIVRLNALCERNPTPVSMFKPEIFKVGSELNVKISCVNSPSEFWCQLQSKLYKLTKLMEMLQQYYEVHADPLQSSELACVVKCSESGKWYRGFIVKRERREVDVFLVDFGNILREKKRNVRAISQNFLELEGQAFRCSLYNLIESIDDNPNDWCEDAIKLLRNFTRQHSPELKCIIYAQQYVKGKGFCNVVDIQTPFQKATQLLIERGFARGMSTSKQLIESVHPHSFFYSSFDIKIGSEELVYVTHVRSPWEIYCQLDRNTELIDGLMEKIKRINKTSDQNAGLGRLCLAKYPGDGLWYRGLCFAVKSHFYVGVFYVDYGDMQVVDKRNVLPIPPDATDLLFEPMQTLQFCLSDIPKGEILSEVNAWLEKHVVNKQLKVIVLAKEDNGTFICELYDGNVQINEKVKKLIALHASHATLPVLDKEPVATKCETSHFVKCSKVKWEPKTENQKDLQQGTTTNQGCLQIWQSVDKKITFSKTLKDCQRREPCVHKLRVKQTTKKVSCFKDPKVCENINGDFQMKIVKVLPKLSDLPQLKIKPGFKGIAFVSHINADSNFYIQMEKDEQAILNIVEELNAVLYKANQENFIYEEVNIDDLVAVKFEEDGSFYRSVVKERTGDGCLQVEFIDYGNTAKVEKTNMLRLPDKCLTQRRLSIPCFLETSHTLGDGVSFRNKVADRPLLVEFVQMFGSQWEIIIKIKGEMEACVSPHFDSTLNSEGTDSGWFESYPHNERAVMNHEYREETAEPQESLRDIQVSKDDKTVKLMQNVKIPFQDIKPGQTEDGTILSVLDSEMICVGLAKNSEQLTWLDLTIGENTKKNNSSLPVQDLEEGLECLAKSKENKWYRAEVQNLCIEKEEVLVFFFDHGISEVVSVCNIKELRNDLKSIPRLAVLCKLSAHESHKALRNALKSLMGQDIKLVFISFSGLSPFWVVDVLFTQQLEAATKEERPSLSYSDVVLEDDHTVDNFDPDQRLFLSSVKTDVAYFGFAAAVTDPSDFYITLEDLFFTMTRVSSILEDLPEELPALPETHLNPGSCCVVKSETKNKWCRGEILKVDNKSVLILLVDYGHCIEIPCTSANKLKRLPEELTSLPKVTYPCILRGVNPAGVEHWTDEAAVFFQACMSARNLVIYFRQCVFENLWEVDILSNGVNIAKELVEAGHAAYIDCILGLRLQQEICPESALDASPKTSSLICGSVRHSLSLTQKKSNNVYPKLESYGRADDSEQPRIQLQPRRFQDPQSREREKLTEVMPLSKQAEVMWILGCRNEDLGDYYKTIGY